MKYINKDFYFFTDDIFSLPGEIRCYCNQATCVSTGYMCKSNSFCFSDLASGVHGCLDRRRCMGLHCCKEDMCNYMHVDIHAHTHKAPMTGGFCSRCSTLYIVCNEGCIQIQSGYFPSHSQSNFVILNEQVLYSNTVKSNRVFHFLMKILQKCCQSGYFSRPGKVVTSQRSL